MQDIGHVGHGTWSSDWVEYRHTPHIQTLVLGTAGILEDDMPGPTNRYKHLATLLA